MLPWVQTLRSFPTNRAFSLIPTPDAERLRVNIARPVTSSFALEVGPKLVEVKATYTEQRGSDSVNSAGTNTTSATQSGRYLDLFAPLVSRLTASLSVRAELAYSGVPGAGVGNELPAMSRLTLRGNWGLANYGANYRTFGSGFVSTAGLKFDNPRDEREAWGEYDFKLFRLKGSLGESWERRLDTGELTLAKTAATSFNWKRGDWSALSFNELFDHRSRRNGDRQTTAFSNGVSLTGRPSF